MLESTKGIEHTRWDTQPKTGKMAKIKLVLDVLKPHQPNAFEFVQRLLAVEGVYRGKLMLEEMDEKTESTVLEIEGIDLHYEQLIETIASMGGSVHSIDEVEIHDLPDEKSADA